MNWSGIAPPFTLSTNSKPLPGGSGTSFRNTSPNWPAPADCFGWRPRVQLRVLGGVVQHVVELDLVDLGDGADVARQRLVHLDLCLSAQQEQVPGLDRLASFADIELAARGQASLMHAEHR